ncbi:MAG: hypothetical protein AAFQ02_08380 [Bacteroidota bacterium]
MTRHLSITLVLSISAILLIGQTTFQPKPVNINLKGVVYDFETTFEGRLHPQGFSLSFRKGRLKSYYRTTYQNFEFGFYKDGRESRETKQLFAPSGERIPLSFIYGKANQFFTLRYAVGEKRYLSEKTKRKGIAVGLIYEGGVTLGLLKPYSLRVLRLENDNVTRRVETITYDEDLIEDFLDYDDIYGGAGFWRDFDKISPTPGLHGKIGMHWSLGAFEKKVTAVEAGFMADIFPRTIPLLVERDDIRNDFYFFKFYVGVQFGSRRRLGE